MKKHRNIIYLAGFLFSIPIALTSYINSSLLEGFVNPYYVSAIYIVSSLFTILGLMEMPRLLTRVGNKKTAILSALIAGLSLLALTTSKSTPLVIVSFILYFVSTNFILASLDIFIEDFSKQKTVGRTRGLYLTIVNSAWVIAQLVSGTIIAKSAFSGIYLLSGLFMALFCMVMIFLVKKFEDPEYKKPAVWKTIKYFAKNKNISKIYLVSLILKFFFAWMIIYTPLYLHEQMGFAWDKIGIIFTIMLLPFVLVEFPLGRLSDKIGEKKILKLGFLICACATILIPFIQEPKVWLFALVLFMTRVGAATIEIMSESYFFKKVSEESAGAISFFRNTTAISFIIGPLLAIPIIFLVPSFQFLYFVLGAVLLVGYFITLRLQDEK